MEQESEKVNPFCLSSAGTSAKSLCRLYVGLEQLRVICRSGPVVQKMDSTILRLNHYPVDSTFGFPHAYPVDRHEETFS